MPSSYSSRLRLELIGTGEQAGTWGLTTNTNLGTLIEQAIAGLAAVTMTDADYTLTAANGASDEARCAALRVVSSVALTGPRAVICPPASKLYVVINATTGGQAITLRTSIGTGVTVPAGMTAFVACDGTNVVPALNYIGALTAGTSSLGVASATSVAAPRVTVTPSSAPVSPTDGDLWYAGNALNARVDSNTLVVARRPVLFSAQCRKNNIPTGTSGTLDNYGPVAINTGGSFAAPFDATTGVFTAPVTGTYEFQVTGYVNGNIGTRAASGYASSELQFNSPAGTQVGLGSTLLFAGPTAGTNSQVGGAHAMHYVATLTAGQTMLVRSASINNALYNLYAFDQLYITFSGRLL